MKSFKIFVICTIVIGSIFGCSSSRSNRPDVVNTGPVVRQSAAIESCVIRGVAYFQEVGSYPMLLSLPDR